VPAVPDTVVRSILDPLGVVSVHSISPGMSGAKLYRCDTKEDGASLALKRWPRGTRQKRIDEVHYVMRQSRNNGCSQVPLPALIDDAKSATLIVDGYCWDLVEWMPGQPIDVDGSLRQIQAGAETIARFHASLLGLGQQHQVAPAIIDRLSRLQELDSLMPSLLDHADRNPLVPPLGRAIHQASQLLRLNWNQVRPRIVQSLSTYADQPVNTQYVMRDVHRQHILFSDDQPSGLIDFDAVRIDTPAVDLARWAGSFLVGPHDQRSIWEAVLAGIRSGSTSREVDTGESEIDLAQSIALANPWISLANWLVWILLEKRHFPAGLPVVAGRISFLTKSADLGI